MRPVPNPDEEKAKNEKLKKNSTVTSVACLCQLDIWQQRQRNSWRFFLTWHPVVCVVEASWIIDCNDAFGLTSWAVGVGVDQRRGVRVADTRRTGWVEGDSALLLWEARRTTPHGFKLLFSISMPKNSCAVCAKAKCILLKEITVIRSPHPDRSWCNSSGRIILSSGLFGTRM